METNAQIDTSNPDAPKLSVKGKAPTQTEFSSFVGNTAGRSMSGVIDGETAALTSHINSLVNFEEGLKNSSLLKEFFKMSPSIPAGLDMDCTQIDLDDFSTIIC